MNTRLDTPIAFTVTTKGRARSRRRSLVRIVPTPAGVAAACFLNARRAHCDAFANPANFIEAGVPDWDAPEIVATRIVLTVAADAYREEGGTICEDCETLEGCVCPDM